MSVRMDISHNDPDFTDAYCVLNPGYGDSFTKERPLILRETHKGVVLATGERNGYDDSDFTADVWNEADGRIDTIVYASTRGWTYANGATIDATPDVIAKAAAYRASVAFNTWTVKNNTRAKAPAFGKSVRVVRGRNVPKGTEGEVFWVGPDKFARNFYGGPVKMRIGIRLADGSKVFTAESNVDVLGWESYLEPEEAGRAYAQGRA